jgi:hypothetical protein
MNCRVGCAACCVAVSISSPIPGMPRGKPAGIRCVQLTEHGRCKLFGEADRPAICVRLTPSEAMCGPDDAHAYRYLAGLEAATDPRGTGETRRSFSADLPPATPS